MPDTAAERLAAFVPADTAAAIIELVTPLGKNVAVVTPPMENKDSRSSFHALIRTVFNNKLLTEATSDEPPCISIQRSNAQTLESDRRRSRRGGKNHKKPGGFEELGGEYCHFTLYKENRDTMEVLNLLARLLKLKGGGKAFSFAGTKDRRAVTAQRCAAHRIRADRLAGLNNGGEHGLRGARLGDFEYKPHGLSLGDLKGNEFVITLRQAESLQPRVALEDAVKTCVDAVKRSGFANYYGLQRFGSFEVTTSDVGVYLLRGDWRGAVNKILSYNPSLCDLPAGDNSKLNRDDCDRAEACRIYHTTYDFAKASSKMPRKFVAESAILRFFDERGMAGDGKGKGLDYLGAMQAIPRSLRLMYAHAYQSFVWNHVTSARLRMSRTVVLPGDLVFAEQLIPAPVEEVDQDGEVVIAPADSADIRADGIQRARALSAEEAAGGKFSIADVVLPSPGWDIEYPANPELMAVYKEVMAREQLDPLDMRRSVRDYSLTGSYRKIMSNFIDDEISYEVRRCKLGEQVVSTDLEVIERNRDAANKTTEAGEKRKREGEDAEMEGAQMAEEEQQEEEETVVIVRMRLGTSCYATMALREVMKGGVVTFKPEFGR